MDEMTAIQPSRRRMLGGLLGGVGALALAACGDAKTATNAASSAAPSTTAGASTTTTATTATATSTTASAAASSCTKIPEETAGPYPGDGTNGPNVLTQTGVVRSDIRSSFGSSTTVAKGVALTIALTIVDRSTCKPMAASAVYLWHCDMGGNYSMYSQGITSENYLRGVQETDANGMVTFKTIFPAAYSGRWPHIHFEIFPSLAVATNGKNKKATSQLALPEDTCKLVFATVGYEQSVRNLAQSSLKSDNVFSDGWDTQTPTITGSVASGFTAALNVGV